MEMINLSSQVLMLLSPWKEEPVPIRLSLITNPIPLRYRELIRVALRDAATGQG